MRDNVNPFALVRASNYSDAQINSLWVEMGPTVIDTVIEPRARDSKYILGGKGTGKTHLLRYHSYPVIRLRHPKEAGVDSVLRCRYLAVFLRAASVDPARFAHEGTFPQWQQLFGVYFELRLVEVVLEALQDIQKTSPKEPFNDAALIASLSKSVNDPEIRSCRTLRELHRWVEQKRLEIDDAVNNAAFTGNLQVKIPFAVGAFCIPIGLALGEWTLKFVEIPLIYLVDEIENFSAAQQVILNTLVRFGEGFSTFRMTGRLYSRKTLVTLADGEENREGAEFRTTNLDDELRRFRQYPQFARRFVMKRLAAAGLMEPKTSVTEGDPRSFFEEVQDTEFFKEVTRGQGDDADVPFFKEFKNALLNADARWGLARTEVETVVEKLGQDFPLLIKKLNVLLFCKKLRLNAKPIALAERISTDATRFVRGDLKPADSYSIAYSHYHVDLFAQLCRESKKIDRPLYGGFESFVRMSACNPRNLLVSMGRVYELSSFRGLDFVGGQKLPVGLQTQAAVEAARFIYERDTNYGSRSDAAREAVNRLGELLRTARFALNIPEVSPLAVSFASADLTPAAKSVLDDALNYSFVYELSDGRPDRNSEALHRKIQMAPIISPRWGLAIVRGGDLRLSRELVNSVFDIELKDEFEGLRKMLGAKWNSPFRSPAASDKQPALF